MTVHKASRYILKGITPPVSKSVAQTLLVANGYVHPFGKGLLSILPLGQRVLERLMNLVDAEFEKIGALKVSLPLLGAKELWEKTNRWDDMGAEMFTVKDRTDNTFCLQPTSEEMCTQMIAQLPVMKKSMYPLIVYQTTEKFRDEMNPRFGLLRARQFLMKDMYSFDLNETSATNTYNSVSAVYDRILRQKLRLKIYKVSADSGVHGGKFSHEYHLASSLNEDGINYCNVCHSGNKRDEHVLHTCSECCSQDQESLSSIEIAHTFLLGTRYSKALGAVGVDGKPLNMSCYGIGMTRLVAAAAEALSPDAKTLRLPRVIAPFDVAVVVTKAFQSNVLTEMCISTLDKYFSRGGVLVDDRVEMSVPSRLHDLSRIGIPRIVVIGKVTEKTINTSPQMELFCTENNSDQLVNKGHLTLTEIMQVMDGYNELHVKQNVATF